MDDIDLDNVFINVYSNTSPEEKQNKSVNILNSGISIVRPKIDSDNENYQINQPNKFDQLNKFNQPKETKIDFDDKAICGADNYSLPYGKYLNDFDIDAGDNNV